MMAVEVTRPSGCEGTNGDLFCITRVAMDTVSAIRQMPVALPPPRYFHNCSDFFRLERLPGSTLSHRKNAAYARHTPTLDLRHFSKNSFLAADTQSIYCTDYSILLFCRYVLETPSSFLSICTACRIILNGGTDSFSMRFHLRSPVSNT